jgi:xylulokinase
MTRRAFLGIDSGTQSTKALVRDAGDGTILGLGRGDHPDPTGRDGASEQHPDGWVTATETAVRQALAAAGPVEIAGIGVSGQQHGLVTLDAGDRPVRPAKLWNDTSTAPDGAALTERLGGSGAVLERIGNLFLAGYTAPAIAWLRRVEPDLYARTRRFLLPHDYLNLWLTGAFATEPGDASGTAYFDVVGRRYEPSVLDALDPERDWAAALPPVQPSVSVVGELRPEVAARLGLPAGIPVSAGGGDNMCAAIGAGVTEPGVVQVSLGTSGTVAAHSDAPRADPAGVAAAFCDSTGGWLPLACNFNCTGPIAWIRGLLALDLADADRLAGGAPAGARGLTFLPYLAGERMPPRAPGEGGFVGLRADHDRADIVRAVYEGVTFALVDACRAVARTGVEMREIVLVGGGSASRGWAQLIADALGLPVGVLATTEAAAIGAAQQARWAIDGVRPERPAPVARWEPAPAPELLAAWERFDAARGPGARDAVAVPT